MNIHNFKRFRGGEEVIVSPLGSIREPSDFCDIVSKKYGHIACIISISNEEAINDGIKEEQVIWDKKGFPDIYMKDKMITLDVIKKGLKILEKDSKNKFRYELK